MKFIDQLHQQYIYGRRIRVLSEVFCGLIPSCANVLDVGAGDGSLSKAILTCRPDLEVRGIDVLQRTSAQIPIELYDGKTIPFPDNSFDVVMLVDVLHHTQSPFELLAEAARTARRSVAIKDHLCDGSLATKKLRFMDRVGNARYDVALPYNYWSFHEWTVAFDKLGLVVDKWTVDFDLYPWPLNLIFGRSLHFVALLKRPQ